MKAPAEKPVYLATREATSAQNADNARNHFFSHVKPRLEKDQKYMSFDPKMDYDVFRQTVQDMEVKWDNEDAEKQRMLCNGVVEDISPFSFSQQVRNRCQTIDDDMCMSCGS